MGNKLEELVVRLFEIEVVKFGKFKLKSGVESPVYFDLRTIVSHPKLMDNLTTLLVELIQSSVDEKFQHVCGVPYTALPLATLVSVKSGISMLIRRKETKDHGTRKIIEGEFERGDSCIVVEDVISSGSSVLETVEDLQKHGLKVSHAIVVLDREQGGLQSLENRGVHIHVLLSLRKVLKILLSRQKLSSEIVGQVEEYISGVKLFSGGDVSKCNKAITNHRLKMTFSERARLTENKLVRKVFEIIEAKQSLLCLAADVTDSDQLIKIASQVGSQICILKTHFDILGDFSVGTRLELMKLAKTFNFLIMEDRKFSDIGNTVRLQYGQIKRWSDIVTMHSLGGESVLSALKTGIGETEEKGCFLVAELSCEGNLLTKEYADATARMAESHSDFVIGLVCQSPHLVRVPHLIQLTPGVKIEKESDGLGQNYNDPEFVVLERGADVAVVGRGITESPNPYETAIAYKEKLWKAYKKRTTT